MPVWSPDATRVFFASDRTGNFDVYSQAADGASGASVELAAPGFQVPVAFAPDGALIVSENFSDLGLVNLAAPDRRVKALAARHVQRSSRPGFSRRKMDRLRVR